jgi:hypothetical protein
VQPRSGRQRGERSLRHARGRSQSLRARDSGDQCGNSAQPSNTLQSVDVIQNEGKIDQKGVPPLRPGQSYTATYTFTRSVEAADGTTQFVFRIRDCSYAFSA